MKIIRVVDLETTRFAPAEGGGSHVSGVCEIGWCDVAQGERWIVSSAYRAQLLNPGEPIPPENSAIHHIVDRDVAESPSFLDLVVRVCHPSHAVRAEEVELIALAAHNAKFEAQWIEPHFRGDLPLVCTYKAALRHWPHAPQHKNQTLRYWRKPEGLNRAIANQSHRAGPDAYVTAFLLRDMLNDGVTLEQLVKWTEEPALTLRCYIGQYRGMLWSEVEYSFLTWILGRDFDEDVKFSVRHEIERRRAAAEAKRAAQPTGEQDVIQSDVAEDR